MSIKAKIPGVLAPIDDRHIEVEMPDRYPELDLTEGLVNYEVDIGEQ